MRRSVTRAGPEAKVQEDFRQSGNRDTLEALAGYIRFYDLRHTHASLLLAHGESIKAVCRRVGHGTVDIALRVYSHLLPGASNALAERAQKMFG